MSNSSANKSVRYLMLGVGMLLAAFGGGVAWWSGGEIGRGVGIIALALIGCALVILVWKLLSRSVKTPIAEAPVGDIGEAPVLSIVVTPLGRIRSAHGNRNLLAGLKPGRLADEVLIDAQGTIMRDGLYTLSGGQTVRVFCGAQEDGTLYIIAPDAEFASPGDEKLKARTDFFAGLGHDLKSPLNAVIGFSDIMDAEIRGPMPEVYRDYPGLIRESAETLLRLVEDMLGFAKSEAGTYDIDVAPMDIAASGEAVMRQSQAVADREGVSLSFVGDREVLAMADPRAIQRIWDNLVSNAIKYSKRDGVVTLRSDMEGTTAVIEVSDQGAGMSADDLARIATPFEQGANARGRAGTGLGLAMVKVLAEMHGGSVRIRTAPGQGTSVKVSLPAASVELDRAAE
ncbi:MAG: HAMP domain-containing sensor histidine kinase [Henriciella sp.]|jgi:cell cycle sensor histidine kinase DivJ